MSLRDKPLIVLSLAAVGMTVLLLGCPVQPPPPSSGPTAASPEPPGGVKAERSQNRKIVWRESLEEARKEAKKAGKPLLIDFWAPG